MAKVFDITDKLTFDECPALMIKGKRIEVNGDAPTMLKVLNIVSSGAFEKVGNGSSIEDIGAGMAKINEACDLIFPEKSRKEIEKMHLSFGDWVVVLQAALSLVTGDVISRE